MFRHTLLWLAICLGFACNKNAGSSPTPESPAAQESTESEATLQLERANALLWLLAAEAALEAETDLNRRTEDADSSSAPPKAGSRLPDVIYVATPERVVDEMLELVELNANDVLYDLGCGDGRIVVRAAEKYGVRAWGFDIDPARVAEAQHNAKQAGVEDLVTIEERDIFDLDLSQASVVTLYLLPELNVRLIPQLNQMKPGSRVVSHDFDMPGVEPLEHLRMRSENGQTRHDVYLWHTPLALIGAEPAPAPPKASENDDAPVDDTTLQNTAPGQSQPPTERTESDECVGPRCDEPTNDKAETGSPAP